MRHYMMRIVASCFMQAWFLIAGMLNLINGSYLTSGVRQ